MSALALFLFSQQRHFGWKCPDCFISSTHVASFPRCSVFQSFFWIQVNFVSYFFCTQSKRCQLKVFIQYFVSLCFKFPPLLPPAKYAIFGVNWCKNPATPSCLSAQYALTSLAGTCAIFNLEFYLLIWRLSASDSKFSRQQNEESNMLVLFAFGKEHYLLAI